MNQDVIIPAQYIDWRRIYWFAKEQIRDNLLIVTFLLYVIQPYNYVKRVWLHMRPQPQ